MATYGVCLARWTATGQAAFTDYCVTEGLRQPHWHLLSLQRHEPFWHAQEQVPQSQELQQLFLVAFVRLGIGFLLFIPRALHALAKGLTETPLKPYSPIDGMVGWPCERCQRAS